MVPLYNASVPLPCFPMPDAPPKQSPLATIFFTIFIDLLGVGILIPVIPQLLANPASPHYLLPAGMTIDQGYLLLGFLTASYPIAQFFAAPILGQLSDKYGRRRLLALSLLGTSLSYVVFALAILWKDIPLLFLSRIFDGITGGNISVAQAAIADVTTPKNRAKNFGLIGAAFGLGFIIGPYIGGKLADHTLVSWFNASTPFWFAAILSFVNMCFILGRFHETNTHLVTAKLTWSKSLHDIARAFAFKDLRALFAIIFFYGGAFTFFTTFFGVFLIQRFGFTEGNIGDFFAYIGIWIAFTQAVVTRIVAKYVPEHTVLKFALPATGVMIFLFLLPSQSWWFFLIVPLFAIANGLTQANYMGLLSRSAPQNVQGEILGISASLGALSQAVPPILSGYIASRFTPEAPLLVSVVVMILTGIAFAAIYRRPKHHTDAELLVR